ncbi:hypothetical protein Ancab_035459, partial [Ancistrocladus abbreviatus]
LMNIWIGTYKLRVARARNQADGASNHSGWFKPCLDKQRNPDTGVNRAPGEQRQSDNAKCSTNKSYAEALRKNISSHSKQAIQPSMEDIKTSVAKMIFTVPDEEIQWLQGCYVGETYAEE